MSSNSSDEIRRLNEKYEDGLFRLIMNNAAEQEGKLLYEENERLKNGPEYLPSQEDIKRFAKLLDSQLKKTKKTPKIHRVLKILSKTAAALIAIIVIFSAMMLTVQGFRVRVLNFLISIEPKYTSFQLEDNNADQDNRKLTVNWTNTYVPTYIPQGYEVANISYSESIKKIVFNNQDNNSTIIYTEYKSMNSVAIDTEDASLIETKNINGQDGTLIVKGSMTAVVWILDNHLYTVQGQISTEEAVKIAEGVKFVK